MVVKPEDLVPPTPESTERARRIEELELARVNEEREERGIIREPICFSCKHLISWPYCEAYPTQNEGIPMSIRFGVEHLEPRGDDWGIAYEQWTREEIEQLERRAKDIDVDEELAKLEGEFGDLEELLIPIEDEVGPEWESEEEEEEDG